MDRGVPAEDGLGPGSTRMNSVIFNRYHLAQLWERATGLPTAGVPNFDGPIARAIMTEAIEGSDEGEYPLILETLEQVVDDIQSFMSIIEEAAHYVYTPCRFGNHNDCVGEVCDTTSRIPPFCTCPCHSDREKKGLTQ